MTATAQKHEINCMKRYWRQQYRLGMAIILLGFVLMYACYNGVLSFGQAKSVNVKFSPEKPLLRYRRQAETETKTSPAPTFSTTLPPCNDTEGDDGFPEDKFTLEQKRQGAVLIHTFVMIYMFVALATVCDEFFVPALEILADVLKISDDVAGATFMAAGGSAPELFTALIGVFISQSNVGIGTIVGSATFNILFVIAMCTLFSKGVLYLTWWPLFRDVTFYVVDLALLVWFFFNQSIYWYEALVLFLMYILYVTVMKFNVQLESFVKQRLLNHPVADMKNNAVAEVRPATADPTTTRNTILVRRSSIPRFHGGFALRGGIVQLLVTHTLDPMSEIPGTPEDVLEFEKAAQNLARKSHDVAMENGRSSAIGKRSMHSMTTPLTVENGGTNNNVATVNGTQAPPPPFTPPSYDRATAPSDLPPLPEKSKDAQPLEMAWPKTCKSRLLFLFLSPIVVPLWATLPDVRKPKSRRLFPLTFIGSILWIAAYSYLMVWMASNIGKTIGIPDTVMGLTILAAGTSIPDLITSVIVARKGLGDMAVSSSVGSNIFDVTVGLPFPWLLYSLIQTVQGNYEPISVSSQGLACSVGMLFIMLILLIIFIAMFKWQMTKPFGVVMLLIYVGCTILSVLLEMGYVTCPIAAIPAVCTR